MYLKCEEFKENTSIGLGLSTEETQYFMIWIRSEAQKPQQGHL